MSDILRFRAPSLPAAKHTSALYSGRNARLTFRPTDIILDLLPFSQEFFEKFFDFIRNEYLILT